MSSLHNIVILFVSDVGVKMVITQSWEKREKEKWVHLHVLYDLLVMHIFVLIQSLGRTANNKRAMVFILVLFKSNANSISKQKNGHDVTIMTIRNIVNNYCRVWIP